MMRRKIMFMTIVLAALCALFLVGAIISIIHSLCINTVAGSIADFVIFVVLPIAIMLVIMTLSDYQR